jgi:putative heme-binding domain-containing protein
MPRRVAEGVYLPEVSWPEPLGSNAYLVDDGEVTLVDAGLPVPRRSLAGEIRETGHEPADLDRVLLTHYDLDHVGGLSRLELDVPVHLGAADVRLVRRAWSPPWRHHKGLFHRLSRRVFTLSSVDLRAVEDGDRIEPVVDDVRRAVLDPGEEVQDDYKMVMVTTRDGRNYSGNVIAENDSQITMRVVGKDEVVINKSEIQSREKTGKSMMPPGLFDALPEEDVIDLVAYLQTEKQVNLP